MSFLPRRRMLFDVPPEHTSNPFRPRAVISTDRDLTRKNAALWSHQQQGFGDGAAAAVAPSAPPPFPGSSSFAVSSSESQRDRLVEWMDDIADFCQTPDAHERVRAGVLRLATDRDRQRPVTDLREAAKAVRFAARELQSLPHGGVVPAVVAGGARGAEDPLLARCWELYADCLPEDEAAELRAAREAASSGSSGVGGGCRAVPLHDLRFQPLGNN